MRRLKSAIIFAIKATLPTVALSGIVIAIAKTLVDTVDPHIGGAVLVFGLPLAGWFGCYGSQRWW